MHSVKCILLWFAHMPECSVLKFLPHSGQGACRVVATNVFEKQHGQWKIIHHHGSPAPLFV